MPPIKRAFLFFRNRLGNYLSTRLSHQKPESEYITEEKWIADFSKDKHTRFDIKSESSFDVSLRRNTFSPGHSLVLGLKKTSCIAWTEAPDHRYRDLVISGSIRIDALGGYGAGGMMFRMVDNETYYSFLISNKGYFRLDVVRNGMPFPLVGWTELPLFTGALLNPDQSIDFTIIAYGSHIVILLRDQWAAEVNDSSILEGTICFAAASYEPGDLSYTVIREADSIIYNTEVFLESLTVTSHISKVSGLYQKWNDSPDIDAKARLRLTETFTAMAQYNAAYVQLSAAWAVPGYKKTQAELLLAGRLAQFLGRLADAEAYIGQCLEAGPESPEGKEALTEMAKILNAGERYGELANYCTEALKIKASDPMLWNLQGHAYWSLKKNKKAAAAYDKAFEADPKNGLFAKNAANVCDIMGLKGEALKRYLMAGKAFLQAANYNDLGLLAPKLVSLGKDDWEARSLAGKWAFAVEDWKMAEGEFARAEKLRKSKRPKPKKDGAQVFLEALLLVRQGKRREALPLFEEAVSLAKDYALFHFRLAENLFLLDDNPDDPKMLQELEAALTLSQKYNETDSARENEGLEGWINNLAAQIALKKGNLTKAAKHLERAASILGELPAVLVNRAVLFFLQGSLDKALELLDGDKQEDPEGVLANCAGNLLVRVKRFEEADERYRRALEAGPNNVEYLCNRASCLIELGYYGEADQLLAKAHTINPSPDILEMISYIAVKKGEFARAEQACRSALEIDPGHGPSLLSLGWVLLSQGKREEAVDVSRRLEKLELQGEIAKGRDELSARLDELVYRTIECDSCENKWKVPKDAPPAPAIRLYAMPPDNLPAGSCTGCGKTLCIGCAKTNTDSSGRFLCFSCSKPLKLINDGLKKIIHDWAVKDGYVEN